MTQTNEFIIAAALIIIGYDIYRVVKGGYQATISYALLTDSRSQPIIAFAMGVIAGHLFWQNCG